MLSNPDLEDCEIALYDIDQERLTTSEVMARRICAPLGLESVKIVSTMDRTAALKRSDFVILMMQIGGYKPVTVVDF